MSIIFKHLSDLSEHFLETLNRYGTEVDEGHKFDWPNYVFTSKMFRRAHLDIVDARKDKKLYMMHLCIFPHTDDISPIYGFDIIAGPNKVTGAFHDFSPLVHKDHYMGRYFAGKVKKVAWSKDRVLPEWARNIFSKNMIAAGNIQTEEEMIQLTNIAKDTLLYYLNEVGRIREDDDSTEAQNYYCHNQRQNPHTPKVMASLGLDPNQVSTFIETCLFPSVPLPDCSS